MSVEAFELVTEVDLRQGSERQQRVIDLKSVGVGRQLQIGQRPEVLITGEQILDPERRRAALAQTRRIDDAEPVAREEPHLAALRSGCRGRTERAYRCS